MEVPPAIKEQINKAQVRLDSDNETLIRIFFFTFRCFKIL